MLNEHSRIVLPDDLATYRATEREKQRTRDLLALLPRTGSSVLDVGARDGYLARLLTERFDRVIALDIQPLPSLPKPIEAVTGDLTQLCFADDAFDAVVCAEVLEHIPPDRLSRACCEIVRVTRHTAVIGVPYRQDLRVGRTTCRQCGRENPPWGHINSFDERYLAELFAGLSVSKISYVGSSLERTNVFSAKLMSFAGNPFGTYEQEESCVHCGARPQPPRTRSILQRLATRAAYLADRAQRRVAAPQAAWIHVRFDK